MKIRNLTGIIFLVLATVVVLFIACGSDEEPPLVFPETDQIIVKYISPDQAPSIDGDISNESIWDFASKTQMISDEESPYNPSFRLSLVEVKALCDSNYVYISASWQDDSEDFRYREWLWDSAYAGSNPWRQQPASKEDNFIIFFNTGNNGDVGVDCSQMCHEADFIMHNDGPGNVEGWYWRAGLTNPIGYALDMYVSDSVDLDTLFNGADAETMMGYMLNAAPDGRTPKYWHKIDTNVTVITQDPFVTDTSYEYDRSGVLFAQDTVPYVTIIGEVDSIFVPSFVLFTDASGSRWEVEAKGGYQADRGRWELEFKRAMNTGNADDVVFEIGEEIEIVVAVGNNAKDPHIGFEPVILKF